MDNFNGPVGMLIGSGLGITRTMYCNPDNVADFTPVDVCIKAMIVGAWKRAHEPRLEGYLKNIHSKCFYYQIVKGQKYFLGLKFDMNNFYFTSLVAFHIFLLFFFWLLADVYRFTIAALQIIAV